MSSVGLLLNFFVENEQTKNMYCKNLKNKFKNIHNFIKIEIMYFSILFFLLPFKS